jgi:hypothetical protein
MSTLLNTKAKKFHSLDWGIALYYPLILCGRVWRLRQVTWLVIVPPIDVLSLVVGMMLMSNHLPIDETRIAREGYRP